MIYFLGFKGKGISKSVLLNTTLAELRTVDTDKILELICEEDKPVHISDITASKGKMLYETVLNRVKEDCAIKNKEDFITSLYSRADYYYYFGETEASLTMFVMDSTGNIFSRDRINCPKKVYGATTYSLIWNAGRSSVKENAEGEESIARFVPAEPFTIVCDEGASYDDAKALLSVKIDEDTEYKLNAGLMLNMHELVDYVDSKEYPGALTVRSSKELSKEFIENAGEVLSLTYGGRTISIHEYAIMSCITVLDGDSVSEIRDQSGYYHRNNHLIHVIFPESLLFVSPRFTAYGDNSVIFDFAMSKITDFKYMGYSEKKNMSSYSSASGVIVLPPTIETICDVPAGVTLILTSPDVKKIVNCQATILLKWDGKTVMEMDTEYIGAATLGRHRDDTMSEEWLEFLSKVLGYKVSPIYTSKNIRWPKLRLIEGNSLETQKFWGVDWQERNTKLEGIYLLGAPLDLVQKGSVTQLCKIADSIRSEYQNVLTLSSNNHGITAETKANKTGEDRIKLIAIGNDCID